MSSLVGQPGIVWTNSWTSQKSAEEDILRELVRFIFFQLHRQNAFSNSIASCSVIIFRLLPLKLTKTKTSKLREMPISTVFDTIKRLEHTVSVDKLPKHRRSRKVSSRVQCRILRESWRDSYSNSTQIKSSIQNYVKQGKILAHALLTLGWVWKNTRKPLVESRKRRKRFSSKKNGMKNIGLKWFSKMNP